MKKKIIYTCSFLLCLLLSSCFEEPIQNPVPVLNDFDLVFQKIENDSKILVFYNIEANTSYDLVISHTIARPIVFRSDGLLLSMYRHGYFYGYPGSIDLEANRLKGCLGGWVNFWMTEDPQGQSPYDIILATPSNVYRYDLKACEIKEILIDMDNYRDIVKNSDEIIGFSLTPDGKHLYIGNERWSPGTGLPAKYTLFMLELEDAELSTRGVGISPSVSNGGTLLAYFSYDGLYLLDLKTQITEKLLDFPKPNTVYPPQIFWSADDKEMLFHFEPQRKEGSLFDDLKIVVFNLEKKEKTILPVKGLYPSWIQE